MPWIFGKRKLDSATAEFCSSEIGTIQNRILVMSASEHSSSGGGRAASSKGAPCQSITKSRSLDSLRCAQDSLGMTIRGESNFPIAGDIVPRGQEKDEWRRKIRKRPIPRKRALKRAYGRRFRILFRQRRTLCSLRRLWAR